MKSLSYLILFFWMIASLGEIDLVLPLSNLSDITLTAVPIWFARLVIIYLLGTGAVKFGLSVYFLPRYIRKLRRAKSIKKAATMVGSKVSSWI